MRSSDSGFLRDIAQVVSEALRHRQEAPDAAPEIPGDLSRLHAFCLMLYVSQSKNITHEMRRTAAVALNENDAGAYARLARALLDPEAAGFEVSVSMSEAARFALGISGSASETLH